MIAAEDRDMTVTMKDWVYSRSRNSVGFLHVLCHEDLLHCMIPYRILKLLNIAWWLQSCWAIKHKRFLSGGECARTKEASLQEYRL